MCLWLWFWLWLWATNGTTFKSDLHQPNKSSKWLLLLDGPHQQLPVRHGPFATCRCSINDMWCDRMKRWVVYILSFYSLPLSNLKDGKLKSPTPNSPILVGAKRPFTSICQVHAMSKQFFNCPFLHITSSISPCSKSM